MGINFEKTGAESEDGSSSDDDWDIDTILEEHAAKAKLDHFSVWQRLWAAVAGRDLSLESSEQSRGTITKPYHRRTRDNLQADIHLSFDYAMRNEIYTRSGELSKEQQRVLLSFFELLQVTLPQSWAMTKLLQELIDNFDIGWKGNVKARLHSEKLDNKYRVRKEGETVFRAQHETYNYYKNQQEDNNNF